MQCSVEITGILSHHHAFFGKNFVKVTVLLNKLPEICFDEIFLWWDEREFLVFPHSALCDQWFGFTKFPWNQFILLFTEAVRPLLKINWFDEKKLGDTKVDFLLFHLFHYFIANLPHFRHVSLSGWDFYLKEFHIKPTSVEFLAMNIFEIKNRSGVMSKASLVF